MAAVAAAAATEVAAAAEGVWEDGKRRGCGSRRRSGGWVRRARTSRISLNHVGRVSVASRVEAVDTRWRGMEGRDGAETRTGGMEGLKHERTYT